MAVVAPLDVLRAFIAHERSRFVTKDNNLFNTAFSDLVRYRRFLELIEKQHRQTSRRYVATFQSLMARLREGSGAGRMTRRQMADLEKREHIGVVVQLEIESFYLFAKILLDAAARCIEFYFGPVPKLALDSHDDLTKRIERVAAHHRLVLPAEFTQRAARLKSEVSDYRDHYIAHHKNPRTVRGVGFNPEGTTRMVSLSVYPKDTDRQGETKALLELLDDIDAYLLSIVYLLRANGERTRLKLELKPSS